MVTRHAFVVLSALAVVSVGSRARSAHAEEPAPTTSSTEEQAQREFSNGLELSGQERWPEARAAFLRSIELSPRASTYYNLALVCFELGLGRATLDALAGFDHLTTSETQADYRTQAATLRMRAKALVGTLVLSVEPATASVVIDGVAEPGAGAERLLQLDPGVHGVRVSADGREATSFSVDVGARGAVHRRVELRSTTETNTQSAAAASLAPSSVARVASARESERASAPAATSSVAAPASSREGSLLEEPLFWIVTGAVVIGAGVTVGVVASSGESADPYSGTTGDTLMPK